MRSCSRPGEYRATSRHLLSASAWGSGGLAAWVEGCASGLMWAAVQSARSAPGDASVARSFFSPWNSGVPPLFVPWDTPVCHRCSTGACALGPGWHLCLWGHDWLMFLGGAAGPSAGRYLAEDARFELARACTQHAF